MGVSDGVSHFRFRFRFRLRFCFFFLFVSFCPFLSIFFPKLFLVFLSVSVGDCGLCCDADSMREHNINNHNNSIINTINKKQQNNGNNKNSNSNNINPPFSFFACLCLSIYFRVCLLRVCLSLCSFASLSLCLSASVSVSVRLFALFVVLPFFFFLSSQDLKKYLDGLARKGQQLSPHLIKVALIFRPSFANLINC